MTNQLKCESACEKYGLSGYVDYLTEFVKLEKARSAEA